MVLVIHGHLMQCFYSVYLDPEPAPLLTGFNLLKYLVIIWVEAFVVNGGNLLLAGVESGLPIFFLVGDFEVLDFLVVNVEDPVDVYE